MTKVIDMSPEAQSEYCSNHPNSKICQNLGFGSKGSKQVKSKNVEIPRSEKLAKLKDHELVDKLNDISSLFDVGCVGHSKSFNEYINDPNTNSEVLGSLFDIDPDEIRNLDDQSRLKDILADEYFTRVQNNPEEYPKMSRIECLVDLDDKDLVDRIFNDEFEQIPLNDVNDLLADKGLKAIYEYNKEWPSNTQLLKDCLKSDKEIEEKVNYIIEQVSSGIEHINERAVANDNKFVSGDVQKRKDLLDAIDNFADAKFYSAQIAHSKFNS